MGAMGRMCNEMELGGTESGVGKMMDGNEPREESQRGWRAQAVLFIYFFNLGLICGCSCTETKTRTLKRKKERNGLPLQTLTYATTSRSDLYLIHFHALPSGKKKEIK